MNRGVREKNFRSSYPLRAKRTKPWWVKSWRYWYLRLLRLKGKPAEISRGLALGVFAGSFPIFGFQIIIGVLLAVIFKGNKFAAATGTWVSNPLTYVPIFAFNYQVGKLILGWDSSIVDKSIVGENWRVLMESGSVFLSKLFLGCFVVGLIAGICTYFISLRLIERWQRSRQLRNTRQNFY